MNAVDRRGFLSLLGIGAAGLALPKFMIYEPSRIITPTDTVLTLDQFMREIASEFKRALGKYRTRYVPSQCGASVGDEIEGAPITNLTHVELRLPTAEELDWRRRYAEPAGETLAAILKHRWPEGAVFTDSPLPIGSARGVRVSSKSKGFSLRGAVQYDCGMDAHLLHVDMLVRAA